MQPVRPPLSLFLAAGLALPGCAAFGQQTFYDWTGQLSSSWSSPSNWSPAGVPNVPGEVALIVGGSGVCHLDTQATVDKLGVGPGVVLRFNNDADLTVLGTTESGGDAPTGIFSVEGTVEMNSTGHYTDLVVLDHGLTIGNIGMAPCLLGMSDVQTNRIYGTGTEPSLSLDVSLTVVGSGQIGLNTLRIANYGTVSSTGVAGLFIDPDARGMVNLGVMSAESGSTLWLEAGEYDNNGAIVARDGGVVRLRGCTLRGAGQLGAEGTGRFEVETTGGSTTLEGVHVAGALVLPNDRDLRLVGTVGVGSEWRLNSAGNYTDLYCDGPVVLGGGGVVRLSDIPTNRVLGLGGGLPGDALLIADAQVRGSGEIGADTIDIENDAFIVADQATPLVVDPAATLVNLGEMRAEAGGTLRLSPGSYENLGHVRAGDGSVVQLNGCTIGGRLWGSGSGYYDVMTTSGSTRLEGVDCTQPLRLANDRDVALVGAIVNGASIDLLSAGHYTDLYCDGPVVLSGGGSVSMSAVEVNRVISFGGGLGGDALTNLDNTIRGAGHLGANTMDLVNAGTVRADHPGRRLYLDPASVFANSGLIEAAGGGIVQLMAGTFANTGLIVAADLSVVELSGCSVDGELLAEGSGYFTVLTTGGSTMIDGATITGRLVMPNDRDLLVRGAITHAGAWDVGSTGHHTDVYCDGPVSLGGGGFMNLSNLPTNRVMQFGGGLGGDALEINDYTVRGSGDLGGNTIDIVNNGLVVADQSQTLVIDPVGVFTNNGDVLVATGGSLRLQPGLHDHSGGLLTVADGGHAGLNGCVLTGNALCEGDGTLEVLTTGVATTIDGLVLSGRLLQPNDRDLRVEGTVDHAGDWHVASTGHYTDVYCDGPVRLTGGGTMHLSNLPTNRVLNAGGGLEGDALELNGYTIRGSGDIGGNSLDIDNGGAIVADQATQLVIDPASSFVNRGLLHAAAGAGMVLAPGAYTNLGEVAVEVGVKLDLTGGSFTQTAGSSRVDGEFELDTDLLTLGGGLLVGSGLVDSGVVNSGGEVAPGSSVGTLTIEGGYTQEGAGRLTLEFAQGESDVLAVTGIATLAGSVRARRAPGYSPTIGDSFVVVQAGAVVGGFDDVASVGFPARMAVEAVYGATTVTLVVVEGCGADWNGDETVDTRDLLAFLNEWAAGDPDTDFNGDGLIDTRDLLAFLNAWSAGCP